MNTMSGEAAPAANDAEDVASSAAAVAASLSLCLNHILEFHQVRADVAAALKQLPRAPGEFCWEDVPALCRSLQLDCFPQVLAPQAALAQRLPVLLRDAQNLAQVLLPLDGDPRLLVSVGCGPADSHRSLASEEASSLANSPRSLPALIIRPRVEQHGADSKHMFQEQKIDWFWRPMVNFWPRFLEVFVSTILINLFLLLLPLFTLNVYDQVIPNFAEETLIVLSVGVAVALGFDLLLKSIRSYVLEMVAARIGAAFDSELMAQMLAIRPEQMQLSIGERVSLFRELQGIREFYASRLVPTAADLPFFLLFVAVIYIVSPMLAVIPAVMALLVLAVSAVIQIPINRATASQFAALQSKSSTLLETLGQAHTIRLHNAVGHRLFRWNSVADASAQTSRFSQFLFSLSQSTALTLVHCVHVLVVVVGVYQIQSGLLTIGGLIACTILAGRAMAPIVNVGSVVSRWRQSRDVLQSINSVFDLPRETEVDGTVGKIDLSHPTLALDHVTYCYPKTTRAAVSDISLTIEPGEHVALIGPSGAGKSTLAALLAGLMHDYSGDVFIAGVDLLRIPSSRLREQVVIVPQQPQLVAGTVRENITLGLDTISADRLAEACHLSALDDLLQESELGLETLIGSNQGGLSGGQLQAVCLARAIVRNPSIIIFDEPVTGLDASLEQKVRTRLQEYLKGRTLVMITHRTSLLSLVDRLILMDRGRITSDGEKQAVLSHLSNSRSAA